VNKDSKMKNFIGLVTLANIRLRSELLTFSTTRPLTNSMYDLNSNLIGLNFDIIKKPKFDIAHGI